VPFKCIQKGGKWQCVTEDSGKVHGTHDDKASCLNQLKALYANVPEAKKGK